MDDAERQNVSHTTNDFVSFSISFFFVSIKVTIVSWFLFNLHFYVSTNANFYSPIVLNNKNKSKLKTTDVESFIFKYF